MSPNNLPFNWFDVLFFALLLVGVARGRKRGLSQELFTMVLWLVLILACAISYMPLGKMMNSATPFSLLSCYVICYLVMAALVATLFAPLKRALGGKLISADSFGTAEYYVGMPAGVIRFFCILIAMLSLLNARLYSSKEIAANEKYQKDVYGSQFFPGLNSLQKDVFQKSFVGPYIKQYCSFLLIQPTYPEKKQLRRAEEKW